MRTALIGAVESTRVALEALVRSRLAPGLLVTLPPDRGDRHSDYVDLAPVARTLDVPTLHVTDINAADTIAAIAAAGPELCIVVGWSQICRAAVLDIAPRGTIGFHPAALPRMRGRAVIPWTILLREPQTGSTLLWLDEGLDTGDVLLQRQFAVPPGATARTLYDLHLAALADMLPQAVRSVAEGAAARFAQDHAAATWCARRTASDGRIDWRASAAEALLLVRAAGEPYPGAFTDRDGSRITIDVAEPVPGSHRYIGLPGQVQRVDDAGFVVRCGDGECINVRRWRSPSGAAPRLHSILGRSA